MFLSVKLFFSSAFRTEKAKLWGLMVLAAVIRIVYAIFLFRYEELRLPILDAEYYVEWAKDIIAQGWIGNRIFFTEPFYAYFLAGFIKFFGGSAASLVLVFQWLLGATLPVAVYLLAKRLFDVRVALLSGIIAAVYGPFVFYEGLLLKTGLEVWILTSFALYLFRVFSGVDRKRYFTLGLLLGVTVLIKGNNLVFWPLLVGAAFWLHRKLARSERFVLAGLFTFGLMVFIVPVAARNYAVGHDFVPTNYSIGLVLYQGNWYGGDGTTALAPPFLRPHPKFEEKDAVGMAEAFAGHSLKPSEVSRFWIGKTLTEISDNPGHFISTLGNKALLVLNRGEVSDNYSYDYYASRIPVLRFLPGAWPILILGFAGFVRFLSRKKDGLVPIGGNVDPDFGSQRKILLLILIGGYISVLIATNINSRYRLPLFPFLIVFSAYSVISVLDMYLERTKRGALQLSLIAGIFLVFSILPLPVFKAVGEANALFTIGDGYRESGNEAKASEYFEAAKAADDKYAWAYSNLFLIALKQGGRERSFENLRYLIRIRPDDLSNFDKLRLYKESESISDGDLKAFVEAEQRKLDERSYDPWAYEAGRFLFRKDTASAKSALETSISRLGESEEVLFQLAAYSKDSNDTALAKRYYQRAIVLNPWLFPARYNLANIAIGENDYVEVVRQLKDIYETVPELGETWYNYAVALIKTGNTQEAALVASKYVERYKDDPTRKDKVEKFRSALKPNPAADLLKQAK